MKKLAVLFLSILLLASTRVSSAESSDDLHLYLGIPFTSVSEEDLAQILLEQKQAVLEHPYSTADASDLQDFGYSFDFSAFYDSDGAISRIVLYPEGESYAAAEHFRTLVEKQVRQFVDLDRQLTERYGEPDIRFFWAGDGKYAMSLSEAFMPPGNEWSAEALMTVFDSDHLLRARSVWNNVILELWPNRTVEYPRGYLTKLTLSFENETIDGPVKTLREYPQ